MIGRRARRGRIVAPSPCPEDKHNPTHGSVANDVDFSSPAGRAGIKAGDVEVNGRPIQSPADFEAAVRALSPGAPILMRVQRRDVILYVVVDLAL